MDVTDAPVVLFDGVCNLCSGLVQFVIAHDSANQFRFASLQSDYGARAGHRYGFTGLDSMVLVDDGIAYRKSTAALRVAERLDGGWKLLACLLILPTAFRDWVYDFVGNRRYRWFGKKETCWVPDADLNGRFLDRPD